MKLVLGTAALGMNYGLFSYKKINRGEFKKIEKLVLESKIKLIDTASSYGHSEKIIGNSKLKKLNIITKIKLPKNNNIHIDNWVKKKLMNSLNKLRIKRIYGVMVHDCKDLMGKRGKEYLLSLQKFKKKKIINKIGISVYNPKEIKKILKFWIPDLVQIPLNPLDNRILDSELMNILKKFKIKIFARSIFLQGLLVNDYSSFEIGKNYKLLLDKFKSWCSANYVTNLEGCIHFVKQFKKIDYMVVGFNTYGHLKEIIDVFKKKQINIPKNFSTNKLNLIDPRRWN
jgi:aryl-alcohol dehydrogenase-like predicted oxidoreductase